MKQVTVVYSCDNCGRTATVEGEGLSGLEPEGWIILFVRGIRSSLEGRYCSAGCVVKKIEKWLEGEGEDE